MRRALFLLTVLALGAGACAPRLSCREVAGVEVCERRECRDLHDGRFISCPESR